MNKFRNAIYGLAIGDAVGVPYEFRKRGTFECTDMVGYGSHNKPAGTWSDDTSLTLATAESIRDLGGAVDADDILWNFLDWFYQGFYTIDGLFDIGNTTAKALATGEPCAEEYGNGNGSLMRILPLAFTDCSVSEIMEVSALTHAHEIAMSACVIYVRVARALIRGEKIEQIIPTLKCDAPFDRLCYIGTLDEDEIYSDGYVVHTLEAALWALFRSNSFREAILTAVNLGEDTDTTAAVAGGLAGIIWPLDEEWLSKLRGKKIIDECIRR